MDIIKNEFRELYHNSISVQNPWTHIPIFASMHLIRDEDRIVFHWSTPDHVQKFRLSAHLPNLTASYDEHSLGDRLYREPITWYMDCWPYDSVDCDEDFPNGTEKYDEWIEVKEPMSMISIRPSGMINPWIR